MTTFQHRPLAVALALGLGALVLAPQAQAQTSNLPLTQREQRARRMAELHGQSRNQAQNQEESAAPANYPNATRQAPNERPSAKLMPKLKKLQERYEAPDWAGVMADADAVGASPDAGAYEKSFVYTLAGNAAANDDQQAKAADYFGKALEANGLDNNGHYATMYNLVATLYGEEKFAEALAVLDRFLAETKSDNVDQLALRAGLLANLNRNEEAAAAYQALLSKNPNDKHLLLNTVSMLQAAEKNTEANALLMDAYQRGLLTEEREYRVLYIGLMNVQRWDDAQKVIEAGVAKGVLQPGVELSRAYQLLAQTAYYDDKLALAIEMYSRAAPMAEDGEAYLNLAKTYELAGRRVEAREAARQALAKGVKKPEEANRIIGR